MSKSPSRKQMTSPVAWPKASRWALPFPPFACNLATLTSGIFEATASATIEVPSVEPSSTTRISNALAYSFLRIFAVSSSVRWTVFSSFRQGMMTESWTRAVAAWQSAASPSAEGTETELVETQALGFYLERILSGLGPARSLPLYEPPWAPSTDSRADGNVQI